MIRDYYERQILESEAADAEGEPEDDDGDDEFMEVDVEYVSSTFLGDSEEGLALLRAYTKRKVGHKALKYIPWVI